MNTNSSKLTEASTSVPKTVTLTIIYDKVLTINLRNYSKQSDTAAAPAAAAPSSGSIVHSQRYLVTRA